MEYTQANKKGSMKDENLYSMCGSYEKVEESGYSMNGGETKEGKGMGYEMIGSEKKEGHGMKYEQSDKEGKFKVEGHLYKQGN